MSIAISFGFGLAIGVVLGCLAILWVNKHPDPPFDRRGATDE